MYNVWDKKDDGTTEKPFEATLEACEVVLLMLNKK